MKPDCVGDQAPRALPRLTGRGLATYRVLWAFALLAATGAAVAGQLIAFSPTRLLEAVILLVAAAILFRRRSGDAIAAMLSLAFLFWIITASSAWAGMSAAAIPLAMLDRLRFLIFVSAMMLFPAGRFDPRWTLSGIGATFAVFCVGIVQAAHLIPAGLIILPAMSCAALAVAAMRARLASLPPGVQRQQIKWVALGLGAGLCLVGLSRLGGLAWPGLPHAEAIAGAVFNLGVMLMALGVLLALVRFRLYDANAAISRSTTIAALTLALIGIFAGTETVLQSVSQNLVGDMAGAVSSEWPLRSPQPWSRRSTVGWPAGPSAVSSARSQTCGRSCRMCWPTPGKRPISRHSATRCWLRSNAACAPRAPPCWSAARRWLPGTSRLVTSRTRRSSRSSPRVPARSAGCYWARVRTVPRSAKTSARRSRNLPVQWRARSGPFSGRCARRGIEDLTRRLRAVEAIQKRGADNGMKARAVPAGQCF